MASNDQSSWNRPWSTEEIIEHSSNWSLAGDAGLLKYLESFSENLLSKAEETNDNLNKLLDDVDTTSLTLSAAGNEFSSLGNIQFVESRVYEEDESLEATEQREEAKPPIVSDAGKIQEMKEAVLKGIAVVEKYYEKVEVPASDSEDETDFPSFVLRPKDPYIDRPLPYIIGSEEWHKKWHVGLLDSSSESEDDKVSEKYSQSDSEDDLPIQDRSHFKGVSYSGSVADLSHKKGLHPVANSTFEDGFKQQDILGSSDSEDNNSVPVQTSISNNTFARELAAKLGDVIEQNPHISEPEVNRRPLQPAPPPSNRVIGNLFSDEPPPLDEDDMFENKKGIFSSGSGLFDDFDSKNNNWNENKPQPQQNPVSKPKLEDLFDDETEDVFNANRPLAKTSQSVPESTHYTGGLFDEDSSEDDLFNENAKPATFSKPLLQPSSKSTVPFFDDEPPELEPKKSSQLEPKSTKPVGGLKLFGDTDVLQQQKIDRLIKLNRQESSESSEISENAASIKGETVKQSPTELPAEKNQKSHKQLGLFDDDDGDDPFENDLFSNMSTKKFTSSLFDDDSFKQDLFSSLDFSKSTETEKAVGPEKSVTEKQVTEVNVNKEQPNKESRTDEKERSMTKEEKSSSKKDSTKISLFSDESEEDDLFSYQNIDILKTSLEADESKLYIKEENPPSNFTESTVESLFDDGQLLNEAEKSNKNPKESTANSTSKVLFFDENPPEDDEEWDRKSDNPIYEENDTTLFDTLPEVSSHRSSLFDNEPPSLFYESSGIVKDYSTRVETDDSFNPYASSSKRFSTDIFNEQQSNDNFFITKSKSGLETLPDLEGMSAISKLSITDITPSGNVDDLFGDLESSDLFENKTSENKSTVNKSKKNESSEEGTPYKSITDKIKKANQVQSADKNDVIVKADSKSITKKTGLPIRKENKSVAKETLSVSEENKSNSKDADLNKLKIGSPGKLKPNLKINVGALMPGAVPPKRKSLEKSQSFESSTSAATDSSENMSSRSSMSTEEIPKDSQLSSVSYSGSVDVLPSVTKDRAKIAVKRRPSTRKARQESLRKSTTDFKLNLNAHENDVIDSLASGDFARADALTNSSNDAVNLPTNIDDMNPSSAPVSDTFSDVKNGKSRSASTRDVARKPEISAKSDQVFKDAVDKVVLGSSESWKLKTNDFVDDFDSDQLFNTESKKPKHQSKRISENSKSSSIFDDFDSDPLFEGAEKSKAKTEKKLNPDHDLGSDLLFEKKYNSVKTKKNLDNHGFDSDSLFGNKTKSTVSHTKTESVLDDGFDSNCLFESKQDARRSIVKDESNDFDSDHLFTNVFIKPKDKMSKETAKPERSSKGLFADSDEEDNLFSGAKLPSKSNISKAGLFDDNGADDDDIFGPSSKSTSSKVKNERKILPAKKPLIKTLQVKKLDTTTEHPLITLSDQEEIL